MYFTGGSYLGYNDFNDRFMNANSNAGFAPGEDYLAGNTKTTIKIEINPDGFIVYKNGTIVYLSSEVKAGTKAEVLCLQEFIHGIMKTYQKAICRVQRAALR